MSTIDGNICRTAAAATLYFAGSGSFRQVDGTFEIGRRLPKLHDPHPCSDARSTWTISQHEPGPLQPALDVTRAIVNVVVFETSILRVKPVAVCITPSDRRHPDIVARMSKQQPENARRLQNAYRICPNHSFSGARILLSRYLHVFLIPKNYRFEISRTCRYLQALGEPGVPRT